MHTVGSPVMRGASFEPTLIDLPPFLRRDNQGTPSREGPRVQTILAPPEGS
jgi:hypothetical protein